MVLYLHFGALIQISGNKFTKLYTNTQNRFAPNNHKTRRNTDTFQKVNG